MKILRYFPLIALILLGFIAFGLFKTGIFINKRANSSAAQPTLSSLDSNILSTNPDKAKDSIVPKAPLSATNATEPTSKSTEVPPQSASPSIAIVTEADLKASKSATNSSTRNKTSTTKQPTKTQSDAQTTDTKLVAPDNTKGQSTKTKIETTTQTSVSKTASVKTPQSEGRFHVVVGSYASEANANNKAKAFEQKTRRKATVVKQGGYFRVSADDFASGQSATQFVQKLKELGEESIIVKF